MAASWLCVHVYRTFVALASEPARLAVALFDRVECAISGDALAIGAAVAVLLAFV